MCCVFAASAWRDGGPGASAARATEEAGRGDDAEGGLPEPLPEPQGRARVQGQDPQ